MPRLRSSHQRSSSNNSSSNSSSNSNAINCCKCSTRTATSISNKKSAIALFLVLPIFLVRSIWSQHVLLIKQSQSDVNFESFSFGVPLQLSSIIGESVDTTTNTTITSSSSSSNTAPMGIESSITDRNANTKEDSVDADADEVVDDTATERKHAYAMLMAGVDPDRQKWYHAIIYNAMVVSELLTQSNSTSDLILMVQLTVSAKANKLSDQEEGWLRGANIIVKYIPIPDHQIQNFYTVQFEKFRILQYYKDYSRILFLDGDVMPHCSLDYLFELSEEGVLKENMVIAWASEPSSGGFFMLAPKKGDYEELTNIIDNQQRKALTTGVVFDKVEGWGHKIVPPDHWKTNLKSSTGEWGWHGDFVDQGLLYYWVKYHKKNVSIIIRDMIEQYVADTRNKDEVVLEGTLYNNEPFQSRNCDCRKDGGNPNMSTDGLAIFKRLLPFRDFVHFSGKKKPWDGWYQKTLDVKEISNRIEKDGKYDPAQYKKPQEVWYYHFWKIHERLKMGRKEGIDEVYDTKEEYRLKLFRERLKIPQALHGGFPTHYHASLVIQAKFGMENSFPYAL